MAAWSISVIAERHPELFAPHLAKLVSYLPHKDVHNAVKRSITRLLQYVDVPKHLRGKVFCYCIDLLADPNEPVAVRCFALTAASRIAADAPSLMSELRLVARDQSTSASAGLKVRIRRLDPGE